jgi:aryl-alcohol dehydrogenase-like predicted oxidoreductase
MRVVQGVPALHPIVHTPRTSYRSQGYGDPMTTSAMPTAPFGRTGHVSSRVIFGAAALGSMSQERADATLAVSHAAGINHIDTAAGYGESEVRLAPYLARHRAEVFLATKTDERSGEGARRGLEESLRRMGVDSVDLIQMHNLVEPDDWDVAHGPGGAVEAMVAARDEGLVRFIGVTGHGRRIPGMHQRSLERFDHDAVLLPYNHSMMALPDYRADTEALLSLCADRGVAVQTIKSVARRRWADADQDPRFAWYHPLPAGAALDRAVAYVLGRDQLFLNSSSDARLLPAIIAAAQGEISCPSEEALLADERDLGVTALFDGSEFERI